MLIDSYTFQQTTPPQTRPHAHMRVHMDLFGNFTSFYYTFCTHCTISNMLWH